MKAVAFAGTFLLSSAGVAQACDFIKDPRPTWDEMIGQADIVFVGEVVEIVPRSMPDDADRAVFRVDRPVKGDMGATFNVAQGMNSCMEEFEVGDRAIFAGMSYVADGGVRVTYAESTGWDPTVLLADPPSPEQLAQLGYLNHITEHRYEATP
jgi:hypothetical protein